MFCNIRFQVCIKIYLFKNLPYRYFNELLVLYLCFQSSRQIGLFRVSHLVRKPRPHSHQWVILAPQASIVRRPQGFCFWSLYDDTQPSTIHNFVMYSNALTHTWRIVVAPVSRHNNSLFTLVSRHGWKTVLHRGNHVLKLLLGIEPRIIDYKSIVLPLNYKSKGRMRIRTAMIYHLRNGSIPMIIHSPPAQLLPYAAYTVCTRMCKVWLPQISILC